MNRYQLSHTRFSIIFPALLFGTCNALNIDRLARWFYADDRLNHLALSAYLLAGLCLLIAFFTLLAHRRTVKPLAIVLAVLSATAAYFISKYDVAVDDSMVLNAVHTDATEVGQLLSWQMAPYVLFLMAVPAWTILSIDITFQAAGRYLLASLRLIATALLIAIAALYSNYNAIHRAGNISNKYIVYSLVPVNVISSSLNVLFRSLKPYLAPRRKGPEITGRVASPGNLVVVLAIGEASRRRNFSIYGYRRRNTNPVLQDVEGLHLLNGIAKRGSTLNALPEILEKEGVKLPAIVSGLGITTACYVNYTLYDNCASVGETKVGNCGHRGKCYDEDVVPLLENNLRTFVSGYRFVVLHLGGGSHGPVYGDRHPPEFLRFEPMCNEADVGNQCTVEQLYNSYDNTILYADHVLGEIIQRLDRSRVPYVFMYVSDHGESLLEEDRLFHGMPPGIPLPEEQSQVPLIVKASVPISIVQRTEYLQPDIFDTVLDLFSIRTTMFNSDRGFIRKGPEPATHD